MTYFTAKDRAAISLPVRELIPGILLAGLVTAAAFGLRELYLFAAISPMMGAILIGIIFNNSIGVPENARAGIALCGKRLLRLAVALLGFQLTIWQVSSLGIHGMAAAALVLATTFAFTVWLGRLLGIERGLTLLIAAGTSVCGASAIAAMNDTSRARDEDVAYAIATVTLFGTIAMFLYPMLIDVLHLSPEAYGFWIGVSVHEVAQVVAAAFQGGEAAGQAGVIVKLTRVMMLAPLVLAVGLMIRGRTSDTATAAVRSPVPVFVLGFISCMLINSFMEVPEAIHSAIVSATPIMLTMSLGAIGLGTHLGRLRQRGVRPFLLAAAATIFIALAGLLAVSLMA
ncbi:MAG: YeiH family protein [Rhizobiaceae bacterium]|nr:YeiH family protein [Rhizobiaceae bacterium]